MSEPSTFIVGEFKFKVEPLKLKKQQRGLALVTNVLLPAFAGMAIASTEGIANALRGLDHLPEIYDLFADVSKVEWNGNFVPLKTFEDNVFCRRADLMVGYVAECVHAEYSSFLDERGKAVLAQAGSLFASLLE